MPGHLPGKGHGCLGARASIVSSCCTFPVSGEQAANTSSSACAGIGSVFGAAMPWCRHYGSSTAARVHPKGWRQLPGRALPGRRGLVKHRGRGAERRPLEHGSSQWVFAQQAAELQQKFAAFNKQLQEQKEQHQKLQAELAPLQSQFTRNVVPQAAKFALTRSQPCARTTTSTYVDNASPEQLQALADVVGLSAGELKEGLTAMARLHNGGDHPGDLATLQRMVKDALQVCGERPTDPELAFAQRVLLRYAAIEDASLLPHPSAR
ncbi:hypothetical protein HYH02_004378 [Chlamydomonas schloesseri]|uniref:Uncharacterized protein n=1 Tax=Chlamydomonas schloesseri TaxID=2026947 RepID=A0A835WR49_9CHLO|nr:hypothetical protein HYH02_004378 [Chlamydomonas schloesseri]|eukprot:KAG2451110.1 hypothetical protein HYH02_004378 [Chlamydomonas schloesseri]